MPKAQPDHPGILEAARRIAAQERTPSGLDEFHPDTTHNPSSAPSPGTGSV